MKQKVELELVVCLAGTSPDIHDKAQSHVIRVPMSLRTNQNINISLGQGMSRNKYIIAPSLSD